MERWDASGLLDIPRCQRAPYPKAGKFIVMARQGLQMELRRAQNISTACADKGD
jgi:hypothetical protein